MPQPSCSTCQFFDGYAHCAYEPASEQLITQAITHPPSIRCDLWEAVEPTIDHEDDEADGHGV